MEEVVSIAKAFVIPTTSIASEE